jgi:Rrf2 family nitric oxide-sensitive transcriptional repressor
LRNFDISKQHLMKVVNDLSRKGYLDAVRGRGGGIRFAWPAGRHQYRPSGTRDRGQARCYRCLSRSGYCPIDRVCVLRGVLHDAIQAFLDVLDGYTLADLIKPQQSYRRCCCSISSRRVPGNGRRSCDLFKTNAS